MEIDTQNRDQYSQRQWTQIINSVSGFKSVNLLSTISSDNIPNLAVISSCFHLGAKPPLLGFILRPHSKDSPRHSLVNIQENGVFSLNHITKDFFKKAHQASARYDFDEDEYQLTGLESELLKDIKVPFVKVSPLKILLKLVEIKNIEANNTNLVIGEIQKILFDEKFLKDDGYIDIEAMGSLCVSGLDSYHETSRLSRLSYAKPGQEVREIDLHGPSL